MRNDRPALDAPHVGIRLTQKIGRQWLVALIDADDYDRVSRMRWYPQPRNGGIYAMATSLYYIPKHHKCLHAFIMKAEPGQIIDHINGDTLDNRKANLRFVSAAENARNARRPTFVGKTSKFKGVYWLEGRQRWMATITCDGVQSSLGVFSDEAEAARAYDEAAIRLFGAFARTNADMKLYEIEGSAAADLVPTVQIKKFGRRRSGSRKIGRHYAFPVYGP
jgi:hypothetical protein